jgi:hypothetical protein
LIPDPLNHDLLYAVDQDGFLLHSMDAGISWRGLGTRLPEALHPLTSPAIAVSSEEPATLWFAGAGLWRLDTEELQWELVVRPPAGTTFTAVAVSPLDAALVLAGDSRGQVHRLENASDPVEDIGTKTVMVHPGRLTYLGFDPDEDERMIATFAAPAGVGADGLLWSSQDSGMSWTPMDLQSQNADEQEVTSTKKTAVATSNNCRPTISPSSFRLSGAAQEKTVAISFRRAKDPAACHWQPYETTSGTLTIVNVTRSAGTGGPGTVRFKITQTNRRRTVNLYFNVRPAASGPWTIKKTFKISQRPL